MADIIRWGILQKHQRDSTPCKIYLILMSQMIQWDHQEAFHVIYVELGRVFTSSESCLNNFCQLSMCRHFKKKLFFFFFFFLTLSTMLWKLHDWNLGEMLTRISKAQICFLVMHLSLHNFSMHKICFLVTHISLYSLWRKLWVTFSGSNLIQAVSQCFPCYSTLLIVYSLRSFFFWSKKAIYSHACANCGDSLEHK